MHKTSDVPPALYMGIEAEIYKSFHNYNQEYYNTPSINKIIIVHEDEMVARVKTKDLYNGNYVLEITKKFCLQNSYYRELILFHEFTHIYDSLELKRYNFNDFCSLMAIYSEMHASEIMLKHALRYSKVIDYNSMFRFDKVFSIHSFCDKNYTICKKCFYEIINVNPITIEYVDEVPIYYFMGYLKALKEYGIQYRRWFITIKGLKLSILYKKAFAQLIKKKINYNKLLKIYNKIYSTRFNLYIKNKWLNQ